MKSPLPTALTLCLLSLNGPALAKSSERVQVRGNRVAVVIENSRVRVSYDLRKGRYEVVAIGKPGQTVRDAFTRWSEWSSRDAGFHRSWSERPLHDALGSGKVLRVALEKNGSPKLFLDIELHDGSGAVVLNAGVRNTAKAPLRIPAFSPLTGARLETAHLSKAKTLDAPSGALQTQVLDGPYRTSNNNLLLTMLSGGNRRSVVLGGLTYREFCKTASASPAPDDAREAQLGAQGKLAAYLDCGGWTPGRGLRAIKGTRYTFPGDPAAPWANTILFDDREVVLQADRLDPAKTYTLGLSWWDHNADGRRESVWLEPGDGAPRQRLLPSTLLPDWTRRRQLAETVSVEIPRSAHASGRCRIVITNDANVPNAVVSEAWIWEGPVSSKPKPAASAKPAIFLGLFASDPVGRLLRSGETWFSLDRFYLDLTTDDPFLALERYGQAVRVAQNCNPNPYDFPTVCAWYAGVWITPGAQNHPEKSRFRIATTPGLVEEADKIKESGFLNYSRAAGRLVPDNYTTNNPQGWWDDAHWQKEGFYAAPYETSQKWGRAMRDRGVLAITYFQPSGPLHSLDFRESHRQLLLGEDPARLLDYTKPETQAYMRGIYANMRGAISGMMFDYCDDIWARECSAGGFHDPQTTGTAFYRSFLQNGKTGLGPDSWVHERAINQPGHDIALGISDSQRTSGDTDKIDPAMVSKSGLRWYKNRVVVAYDMDSKEINSSWKIPGYGGSDTDGRRMMLTMAYVAASRLLLANSFRDMSPEALHDLERTFPYPKEPRSARPIDAFVAKGWPQVYDFAVTPKWHLLTLYNALLPTRAQVFSVRLSGAAVDGGLGLDPKKAYHVYDFWNGRYVGRVSGRDALKQTLREGEARVLAIHEAEPRPQFLSTNRHIGQGYLDMVGQPAWDPKKRTLSGTSKVVGGETYRIALACNGFRVLDAHAAIGTVRLKPLPGGLAELSIDCRANATVRWEVRFVGR